MDLPHEVLCAIFEQLPLRSLLKAACTCRAMRAAAESVPLRVHVTMSNLLWLERVVSRVTWVHLHRTLPLSMFTPRMSARFTRLETLVAPFNSHYRSGLRSLPLRLRQLHLSQIQAYSTGLTTSLFSAMRRLQVLKLGVLGAVEIDWVPPQLSVLDVSSSCRVFVHAPVRCRELRLRSCHQLIMRDPVDCEVLDLHCDGTVTMADVCPDRLTSLRMWCGGLSPTSLIQCATRLESLHLDMDVVLIPALPPTVRECTLHAIYGFGVTETSRGLPPGCRVSVGGPLVPPAELEALFPA